MALLTFDVVLEEFENLNSRIPGQVSIEDLRSILDVRKRLCESQVRCISRVNYLALKFQETRSMVNDKATYEFCYDSIVIHKYLKK